MVMCRQPATRAPASGLLWPYLFRNAIRPGISFSASMISLRPHSANDMSATLYGNRVSTCATGFSFKQFCGIILVLSGRNMTPGRLEYHRLHSRPLASQAGAVAYVPLEIL